MRAGAQLLAACLRRLGKLPAFDHDYNHVCTYLVNREFSSSALLKQSNHDWRRGKLALRQRACCPSPQTPSDTQIRSLFSIGQKAIAQESPTLRTAHGHQWEDAFGCATYRSKLSAVARVIAHAERSAGMFVSWLQEDSRRVQNWLKRQNAATNSWFSRQQPLQRQLTRELQEMHENTSCPSAPLPERCGVYEYLAVPNPNGHHPSFIRRRESAEQVLLDDSIVARDAQAVAKVLGLDVSGSEIGQIKLSQDQQQLAYTLSLQEGGDRYCACVKDISTGNILPNGCIALASNLEFVGDGSYMLYTVPDDALRPHKVMMRALLDPLQPDLCVLHEADPSFFVDLTHSKDWECIVININSKLSSEVHVLPTRQPHTALRCLQRRRPGLEYFVEHDDGSFYILTNARSGGELCLMRVDADGGFGSGDCGMEHWHMVIPPRGGVAITDMDMFRGRCVLYERHAGVPRVSVLPLPHGGSSTAPSSSVNVSEPSTPNSAVSDAGAGQASTSAGTASTHAVGAHCTGFEQQRSNCNRHDATVMAMVPLPPDAVSVQPGANQDFRSSTLRLSCSSPVHPPCTYDYDFTTGHLHLLARHTVRGHRSQDYQCRHLEATAPDGVQVPLTVVHPNSFTLDSRAPLYLYVYGAYGHNLDLDFEAHRLLLLRRGWAVAFAHVRGGGELGRCWHQGGRQLNKQNSVDDLLACLQHLITERYTSPERIVAHAFSAGGLTLGAAINQRPDLVAGAILQMPFVDLLTSMTDPVLPLTVHEYDEWGDPACNAAFAAIQRLCPCYNAKPARLPSVWVRAGGADARVPYWGPAKFAAALQRCQLATERPVLFEYDADGGHFGGGGEDAVVREYVFAMSAVERALSDS